MLGTVFVECDYANKDMWKFYFGEIEAKKCRVEEDTKTVIRSGQCGK